MASQEAVTVARKPCPCGGGQVEIVLTYEDSDWGMRDQDWHGVISCKCPCTPRSCNGNADGAEYGNDEDQEDQA